MKVLLINGSPHKGKCTYTALMEVSSALNENGIDTDLFWAGNQPLSGCIACKTRVKKPACNAGGGFACVGAMHDSFPYTLELSKMGYNAFALIYRPGAQTACEDLAQAIAFIFDHAK